MTARLAGIRGRLRSNAELAWLGMLVLLGAIAQAVDMFNYPFYQQDEGTYVAQGWAVFHLGHLAPYTYWYDHPPLGWIQLGALTQLVSFPSAIESGRVVMLLFGVGALVLLYAVARGLGRSIWAASAITLAFALSPYGIEFHRRVLLDNIAAFWLLASLAPLVRRRITLTQVWLSALLLGIGILSKEIDLVVLPAFALLVAVRADRSQRWLAVAGWVGIAGSLASLWVVYALLKGELLPPGAPLTSAAPHVSLLGTLVSQAARGNDGGLLSASSGFRRVAGSWLTTDPVLVAGGTIASMLAAVLYRRDRSAAAIGLAVVSVWLFLGRGGETLDFYLVPLLPLLALQVAWLLDSAAAAARQVRSTAALRLRPVGEALFRRPRPAAPGLVAAAPGRMAARGRTAVRVAAHGTAVAVAVAIGFGSLARVSNASLLWTSRQAASQRAAENWVRTSIPAQAGVVVDMYAWLDLHEPSKPGPSLPNAQYYWKVEEDPRVRMDDFKDDWRNVAYVMATPDMVGDSGHLPFMASVLQNADPITVFADGGWPVTIERTRAVQTWPIADDRLLQREWATWVSRFLVDGRAIVDGPPALQAEVEANALSQAAFMDDRLTFDAVWAWIHANLLGADGLTHLPGVDADIGQALLSAAQRWSDAGLASSAVTLIDAIWAHETASSGRGLRLVVATKPGGSAAGRGPLVVDVSALAPAAYRSFAAADPAHPWASVVDGTYAVIAALRRNPATGGTAGVVPHWLVVDPATGALSLPSGTLATSDMFDAGASTLTWRIGLDALWTGDSRAIDALTWLDTPAALAASAGAAVADAYRLDGQPATESSSLKASTAVLPALLLGQGGEEAAARLFTTSVLAPSLATGPESANADGLSWAWYATALMDGGLVDPSSVATTLDWRAVLRRAGVASGGDNRP